MSTFIIRNKTTHGQWTASSGKNAWKKVSHAKAAFANSSDKVKRDPLLTEFVSKLDRYKALYFDDQDVYEVVEVYSDTEKRSAMIEQKLKDIIDTLYGQNLYVANWHLNGDLKPMDEFFEDNDWFIEN